MERFSRDWTSTAMYHFQKDKAEQTKISEKTTWNLLLTLNCLQFCVREKQTHDSAEVKMCSNCRCNFCVVSQMPYDGKRLIST